MALVVGVVGLGAMGSMTALELVLRGHRVIGFDRFRPPHAFGSSTGKTRIIREAYFEHPLYVPLVQRAYERWDALERDGPGPGSLLLRTGGLMIGPPGQRLVSGARTSALEHGLVFEELSPADMHRRFPRFHLGQSECAIWEPRAGVLYPEVAIASALTRAVGAGAELHFGEAVREWKSGTDLRLQTDAETYRVDRVILTAGAWMATELPRIRLPLTVARQALFWFAGGQGAGGAGPAELPIFIWEWEPERMFYGFPDLGDGVKVAIHHEGTAVSPGDERQEADPREAEPLLEALSSRIPGLGPVREATTCLYTNTPNGDFLIDRHPDDERVVLASPCSGHGFKFAPALAEVLADLVEAKSPGFDLRPFRLDRFV